MSINRSLPRFSLYFDSVVQEKRVFGAEPEGPWSRGEEQEFEAHASARLRACTVGALKAGAALAINVLCIVPFSAGHRLHSHSDIAKYLVFTAMGLFLWFVIKVGLVWASWQSARETRREFQ
jgi:hypothetical protein